MKRGLLLFGYLFFVLFSAYAQFNQIGQEIFGDTATDAYGYKVCMSDDGTTVSVSSIRHDNEYENAGLIRVFRNQSGSWVQIGQDIQGDTSKAYYGGATDLSADGSVLVVGSRFSEGFDSAKERVKVYRYQGNQWEQVGETLTTGNTNDSFGYSLCLSPDGSILAVSAITKDGYVSNSGIVRVYKNVNDNWIQLGNDIEGISSGERFGFSLDINNDGSVIAVGAMLNNKVEPSSGAVRVFHYENEVWSQVGEDILGELKSERCGESLSLSARGDIIAVGSPSSPEIGYMAGKVRVFQLRSGNWYQIGEDLLAESERDLFGHSICLSALGNILAVGAKGGDEGFSNGGSVTIYRFRQGNWKKVGESLMGLHEEEYLGESVSLNAAGSKIVVGAPGNNTNGLSSGSARIYNIEVDSLNVLELEACEYFTSYRNREKITTSGVYQDVVPELGKDSIISIDLNIINVNTEVDKSEGSVKSLHNGALYQWINCLNNKAISSETDQKIITNTKGFYAVEVNYKGCIDTSSCLYQNAWTQIGEDIDGEVYTGKMGNSIDLNSDGSVVVIGSDQSSTTGEQRGLVHVYKKESTGWVQKGSTISGQNPGDFCGAGVAISDNGSTIVVGERNNGDNGAKSGQVRVFRYTSNNWEQIGDDLNGEAGEDQFGSSVDINSDGSVIAVGAPRNDGNGPDAGHVRVFENTSDGWTQIGQDIDGEAQGDRASRVKLNADGTILAVGGYENDGNGLNSGHVRVYRNENNTWVQVGNDIDGEAPEDFSGLFISLNADGTILAIGSWMNDENGDKAGQVRVFENSNEQWIQLGNDILGENGFDYSARVALSADGKTIAIGATGNDLNGDQAGYVRVFKFKSGQWVPAANSILGENPGDNSGYSVAMSDDGGIIAISAVYNDPEQVSTAGHVRIFELKNHTSSSVRIDACTPAEIPNFYSASNTGIFIDTISNNSGGDSIIVYDVHLHNVDTAISFINGVWQSQATCADFQWLDCENNWEVIDTASSSSFFPKNPGSYAVEITQNGCIDTSRCVSNIITFTEIKATPSPSFYPNPVKNFITIDLGEKRENTKITLLSSSGLKLRSKTYHQTQRIQLEVLQPPGIYFLKVENEPGYETTFRLVKE